MRRRFIPELDRREAVRVKRRIPCAVMVNGDRHPGVVRDLSAQGLFVEIPTTLALGTPAVVAFQANEGARFVLEASVPNQRHIPHSLKRLVPGGVGLRLVGPPATYQRWVEETGAGTS
jgi:hypothetical protein